MTTTTAYALELWEGDPANLHDLIDRAARDLHRNMRDGYVQGFERDLTDRLLGWHLDGVVDRAHTPDLIEKGLAELVHDKMSGLVAVDCLLDETAASSYDTVQAMAETLLAAIRAQDRQRVALERLVLDEICTRARYTTAAEAYTWTAVVAAACQACGTLPERCSWSQNPAMGRGDCCPGCIHV